MSKSIFTTVVLSALVCQAAGAQANQPELSAMTFVPLPTINVPAEADITQPVVLNMEAFDNDTLLFHLDAGEVVRARVDNVQIHSELSTGWSGTIDGVEHGWFSFVEYDDAVHGAIFAGDIGTYELRLSGQTDAQNNRVYNLIKLDMAKFAQCGNDQIPQNGNAGRVMQANQNFALNQQKSGYEPGGQGVVIPDPSIPEFDDGSVIDVMIVYTAQARSGWGGTNAILALAQNSIDTTNIAYSNSDIGPLQLNLVHTEEINYTESGSASSDITRLQGTNDGFMDNVHALRDTHAADLVAMLVNSFNACGVGYLAPFSEEFGFTVTDTGCAVGNLSFPHEIGHNAGCAHDRNNAGGSTYNYAYGHRWNGNNGTQYRSVMSYSPGSRVPYFSNPGINYQGTPTGVNNSEDNARCHDNTRSSLANFRDSNGCLSFNINSGPASQSACEDTNVTLSANISGNLAMLGFEWRKNGTIVPGADTNVLQLTNVTAADAGSYTLTVSEPCSSETTDAAILTVDPLVSVDSDPSDTTVDEGQNASFSIAATGEDFYQWFGPAGLLVFENADTLLLTNVTQADAGEYYCFVSGPCSTGSVNSATALLTVNSPSDCVADTNHDGALNSADFTAWIAAFNAGAPECDQNDDGACTPADFTAWIANFNAGC